MAKEKVLAKVATLLEKFTERLTRFAEQQSTVEKNIKDLQYQTFTTVERILRVENETRDRETRQTLRDQNNVQSLVNLRESTAKAFNQVRDDITSLIKQVQRLNERVGQVESQTSAGVLNIDSLLRRVTKAETGPSSIDQGIVNSKLQGVYSVTENLETRIKHLEEEIELVAAVRKANEAFLRGPVKHTNPEPQNHERLVYEDAERLRKAANVLIKAN